jgi:hypothetical protein
VPCYVVTVILLTQLHDIMDHQLDVNVRDMLVRATHLELLATLANLSEPSELSLSLLVNTLPSLSSGPWCECMELYGIFPSRPVLVC